MARYFAAPRDRHDEATLASLSWDRRSSPETITADRRQAIIRDQHLGLPQLEFWFVRHSAGSK
jgi:hypothetical protein